MLTSPLELFLNSNPRRLPARFQFESVVNGQLPHDDNSYTVSQSSNSGPSLCLSSEMLPDTQQLKLWNPRFHFNV